MVNPKTNLAYVLIGFSLNSYLGIALATLIAWGLNIFNSSDFWEEFKSVTIAYQLIAYGLVQVLLLIVKLRADPLSEGLDPRSEGLDPLSEGLDPEPPNYDNDPF
jgi:hypothetical protein